MVDRDLLLRSSALAAAAVIAMGDLAACNRANAPSGAAAASADALPLTTAGNEPRTAAPAADALPAAAPAPVVRVRNPDDAYAYLDDAYYQGDAFEDAPPDYAFDYDGASPWAWQGDDGSEFAEPVDGGYRYYYYRPGAAWPYLIRDGGYAYGFDGPQLVVVYDNGRLLPRADIDRRADLAGRYLARSQGILQASRQAGRRGVAAANWAAARPQIAAGRAELSAARGRQGAWQAYDQAHAAQAAHWDAERDRRQDYAQRFEGWRRADFQGAPPAPAAAPPHAAGVRQAQAAPPAREGPRSASPPPAFAQRPAPPEERRGFGEPRQAGQEPPRRQAEQRQAPGQGRPAEQQRRFAELPQPNQAAAPPRQEQVRQQAAQPQRQVQDQLRQQEQRAQTEQARQQAFQQQQQQRQAQEQARRQTQQEQQQQRQAQQQARQQAEQAQRAQAEQARQQVQQQRQAQAQAEQQARQQAAQHQRPPGQPGQPPAAHPAGREEHRDHKGRDDKP